MLNLKDYEPTMEFPKRSSFGREAHWKVARDKYHRHCVSLQQQFKADLKKDTGLPNSFIELAWLEGYSAGYSEIVIHAQDYVEAIEDAKKAGEL